ncbi:MAG: AMP-dependent synthetase [Halioglobus sp.]|nr:AMP-dependent synthetase [Halioglobus sp.]|tara:strand:- start:135 stop:1655 length:1521 start_codon:yes stop_codon:yes gene_type:complete
MNIALLLQMAADAAAERSALVCDGRHWSYGELLRAARGAATHLSGSGCACVALLDESSAAAPVALFGAALAGMPYVPLNYRLADADLGALLQRIAPAYIVGDTGRVARLAGGQDQHCTGREDFLAAAQQAEPLAQEIAGEGIAAQIFTSGTTAAPKAALLRHANLLGYILGTVEFGAADADDAALVCVPPYHIAGISALLSSVYALRRMVILPAFDPQDWLRLVQQERVSNAFVVPTMLGRIVDQLEAGAATDLSCLRALAYGGGRMPPQLIERALRLLPDTEFTNAYGLTETSSTIALLGPREHRQALDAADPVVRARLASVGQALPTVEIEIRDATGRALPAGQRGEIYVRGEQVSGEYRERSALDEQGWFPTRDAGWLDEDGYLFLAGRADDVIVRGGENISPAEIEDVLTSHPAIADAAAVGVPSPEWGEAIAVAVVARPGSPCPGADELRELVRSRLRSSRVPQQVRVLDALPYNEMGKLLRCDIRALFQPRPASERNGLP